MQEVDKLIKYITEFPPKETISYETEILGEEISEIKNNFENIITNKIWKTLYSRELKINYLDRFSIKQLYKYYQKYYQNPCYIITDENNNIYKTNNINPVEYKQEVKTNAKSFYIKYKWNYEKIIYTKLNNPYCLFYIYFLYELIDSFNYYHQFHEKNNFEFPDVIFHDFPDFKAVSLPSENNFDFSKSFFENCKEYFLEEVLNFKYQRLNIESIILIQEYLSDINIKKFIKNLDYSNIWHIINK